MPTKSEQFAILDSDRVDLLCIARDMFTAVQSRMAMSSSEEMTFVSPAEEDAYKAAMHLLETELSRGACKVQRHLTGRTILSNFPENEPAPTEGAVQN